MTILQTLYPIPDTIPQLGLDNKFTGINSFLGSVNGVQQVDTLPDNNATVQWLLIGTVGFSGTLNRIFTFDMIAGSIGGRRYSRDSVTASGRGFANGIALTQDTVEKMVEHVQMGMQDNISAWPTIGVTLVTDGSGTSIGINVWVKRNAYNHGIKFFPLNVSGGTYYGRALSVDNGRIVTTEPAGILYATPKYVYTSGMSQFYVQALPTSNVVLWFQDDLSRNTSALFWNRATGTTNLRAYATPGGSSADLTLNATTGELRWSNNLVYTAAVFDWTTFAVTGSAARFSALTLHSNSSSGTLRFTDPADFTATGLRYYVVTNSTSWSVNTSNDDGTFRRNRFTIPRDTSNAVLIDGNTVWHAGNVPSPVDATKAAIIESSSFTWEFRAASVPQEVSSWRWGPFVLRGYDSSGNNVRSFARRAEAGTDASSIATGLRSQLGGVDRAWIEWYLNSFRICGADGSISASFSDSAIWLQKPLTFSSTALFNGAATFSSIITSRTGAPNAQMIFHSIGWNNGVQRWAQVMEATGAYVWYCYNATGGNPTAVLSMTNPANGLGGTNPGIGVAGQVYVTQGVQAPNWGFTTGAANKASFIATGSYGGGFMCQDNAGAGIYYGGMYAASGWVGLGLTAANSVGLNKVLRLTQEQYMTVQTDGGFAARGGSSVMVVEERSNTNVQFHMYATDGAWRVWDNVTGADNLTCYRTTGDLYIRSWGYAANFAINSDRRIKTWISDLDPEEELDKVVTLVPRLYLKDNRLESGVYAQDVQERWSHMVTVSESNPYGIDGLLTVAHTMLHAPLVASIQALHARIEKLQARLQELEPR